MAMAGFSEARHRLARSYRRYRYSLRDFTLGLAAFHVPGLLALGFPRLCGVASAATPDSVVARAIDATSPASAGSENAIMDTVLHGAAALHAGPGARALLTVALTFSLLVACNLALLRHLRRVNASQRRGGGRRGH